ncbi:MAG: bifunctional 2-C-methyl-D-erythritol 4-phosphate cytidylyltransferase/2-C-methyl-D-erythritol 2,4-cyclodiphosphate synthase [Hyphomicrobium sp.]|jgi:2-C-methyl-D-erythritol 4-phosphate cytidylyltransferase/2-C-methyl-D-erythritol 2,4-cyclodiphosphate synthase
MANTIDILQPLVHVVTTAALIVAAGRGSRASREGLPPKQYASLGTDTVVGHTIRAFAGCAEIGPITVVIHPDDVDLYQAAAARYQDRLQPVAFGGTTRQASVRLGLEAISTEPTPSAVLIHDAARPFVEPTLIARVVAALSDHPGAIAAEPLADTLKRASSSGTIAATIERAGLWRAQTPQGFRFPAILDAHRRAAAAGRFDFTDDAALAEWAGLEVALVTGSSRNIKLTTREDLAMAEHLLARTHAIMEPRVGSGFDVHKFTIGDHVWLCGIRIPHNAALEGHSDADAPLHALTDAILGALGDGDIGQHFPPSDPKWKGARSRLFVEDAVRRLKERGGRIANVDITILCEAPRIGPHRDAMQAEVASMLGLDPNRVGIKATTTETLGFTGRREGLAALVSAMVMLPT